MLIMNYKSKSQINKYFHLIGALLAEFQFFTQPVDFFYLYAFHNIDLHLNLCIAQTNVFVILTRNV